MNKPIHVYMQPRRYGQTYAELIRLTKENEKLKSIINELQQWLEKLIDNFDNNVSEATMREQSTIQYVYDYLQELKEYK